MHVAQDNNAYFKSVQHLSVESRFYKHMKGAHLRYTGRSAYIPERLVRLFTTKSQLYPFSDPCIYQKEVPSVD